MKQFIKALPVLSIVLALALDALLPDNLQHPAAEHPYFTWLLIAALVLYLIFYIASFARPALREKLEYKALFYAGAALFFNILNLLTVKFAVLPVLYFPSLDRVFGVLVEDSTFLAKCLAYSARLLLIGWFCGALVGMLTVACLMILVIFGYVQLFEASSSVSKLENQLANLKEQQLMLQSKYDAKIDLAAAEAHAAEIGLTKCQPEQIVYVSFSGTDQAEIYTQQRTSVFGEILDAMQQSIFGLIEYLHPTA